MEKLTLFIDIDGVLISSKDLTSDNFDIEAVDTLNQIIEELDPHIVLSSDWRICRTLRALNNIFNFNGIKGEISDITPDLWGKHFFTAKEIDTCRASEILLYINEHNIEKFVVFDDLDLSGLIPNFIHIDHKTGLTKEHKEKMLELI